MLRDIAPEGLTEVDLLARHYLQAAHGDAHAALRLAVAAALREAVDARIRILELERAVSLGYLRRRSGGASDDAGVREVGHEARSGG